MVKLCLTIGVSKSSPLASLPGAITAAHEVSKWAKQSGFLTEMITDEGGIPVTIARIRETLLGMLPDNDEVELFLLHFAGHGFRTGAEQNVWLPSDWHQEMRGISVEGLRKRLYRHGIKSLSIFGDACRSLPTDVETADITADPVLPRGPYDEVPPIVDRFNAVMDGQQAYMLKGDENAPPRCIFSTVIIEGLQGHYDGAFDEHLQNCVIPESLALFSKARMQEIGELYNLKCSPDYTTGIPRGHTIYYKRSNLPANVLPPRWPAPPKAPNKDAGIPAQELYLPDDELDQPKFLNRKVIRGRQYVRKHFSIGTVPLADSTNLVVLGKAPKQIWTTSTSRWNKADEGPSEFHIDVERFASVQILVEFYDGIVASAVVYDDLITVLTRDENGLIGWACINRWGNADFQIESSLAAITNLQLGNISVSQVDTLATALRAMKHINPTLGAISSYLYDYAGDVDSIRRMAFYYCSNHQAIPFDIAFMGLLPTRHKKLGYAVSVPAVEARIASPANSHLPEWVTDATTACEGVVAGLWPWLHQGWQFVEDPADEEKITADSLYDVIPYLLPSQFSSFLTEGAEILIRKFHMKGNL